MAEITNKDLPGDTHSPENPGPRDASAESSPDSRSELPNMASHDFKLPEAIPTRWLDEIKAAVSGSRRTLIITTVLGSSLLTGIVTTGASYYLEARKTTLQLKMEDAKETLRQYNELRDEINGLKYELNTGVIAFSQASAQPGNTTVAQNADTEITALLDHEAKIEKSVAKLDDPETFALVDKSLAPLVQQLADSQANHDYKTLVDLCSKTGNEGIPGLLSQIIERKERLSKDF